MNSNYSETETYSSYENGAHSPAGRYSSRAIQGNRRTPEVRSSRIAAYAPSTGRSRTERTSATSGRWVQFHSISDTATRSRSTATSSDNNGLSNKEYKQQCAANSILDRFKFIPPEEISEKHKKSIAWAIKVVTRMPSATAAVESTPKRNRSLERARTAPKRGNSKGGGSIPPKRERRPQNQTLKGNLIYAVIDWNNPDGTISPSNWKKVQAGLTSIYISLVLEHGGPAPTATDAGWHQGRVKLMAFSDQRSADLFKLAIHRLGPVWRGARLDVVSRDQAPIRPRAGAMLPYLPSEPSVILELIKVCNPNLPTENWKIVKLEEPKGGRRHAVFVVNKESLAPLAKTKGVMHYGFSTITVKVYKQDKEFAKKERTASTSSSFRDEESAMREDFPSTSAFMDEESSIREHFDFTSFMRSDTTSPPNVEVERKSPLPVDDYSSHVHHTIKVEMYSPTHPDFSDTEPQISPARIQSGSHFEYDLDQIKMEVPSVSHATDGTE